MRYPQEGTIRSPLCVVTVLPEDGQPYELAGAPHEWGQLMLALSKVEPVAARCLYEKKAVYAEKLVCRSKADVKRLTDKRKQCERLAMLILKDLLGSHSIAYQCAGALNQKIIEKLPELEWYLTAAQIDEAVGVSIVLAGLANIGEGRGILQ